MDDNIFLSATLYFILWILGALLGLLIWYLIMKAAVKNGVKQAYEDMGIQRSLAALQRGLADVKQAQLTASVPANPAGEAKGPAAAARGAQAEPAEQLSEEQLSQVTSIAALLDDPAIMAEARQLRQSYGKAALVRYLNHKADEYNVPGPRLTEADVDLPEIRSRFEQPG